MKVVIDTNVLVSALLKPKSKPAKILRLVIQGNIEIIVNDHILAEYYEVPHRPKFRLNPKEVDIIMDFFHSFGIKPPALPQIIDLPDPSDAPFVEAAIAGRADAIVTGNQKHFPDEQCKGILVASPSEFLGKISSQE